MGLPELPLEAFGVYRSEPRFSIVIDLCCRFEVEQITMPNGGVGISSCFLWSSSVGLATFVHRYLCCCERSSANTDDGMSVLELAAGFALPARVLARCGGFSRVVATEIGEPLKALQQRVDELSVMEFDWLEPRPGGLDGFDVVLAADCIYSESLHAPLIGVIGETLSARQACAACQGRSLV
jgi:predicted nicotinamide N-methyase